MSNPPSIVLSPGHPIAFNVVVTSNGVLPDGSNPGTVDTTSALVFQNINNAPTPGQGVVPSVDPNNNRRVICTAGSIAPGAAAVSWQFRISVAGRTAVVMVVGTTNSAPDVSGVSWDGIAPTDA